MSKPDVTMALRELEEKTFATLCNHACMMKFLHQWCVLCCATVTLASETTGPIWVAVMEGLVSNISNRQNQLAFIQHFNNYIQIVTRTL